MDRELTLPPRTPADPETESGPDDSEARASASNGIALVLRASDGDGLSDGPVRVSVKPGERTSFVASVRNESSLVDNYDITVTGLPTGWVTVAPATLYLNPYSTNVNYEQEVEVQLHPPRGPEVQARDWSVEVIVTSRAQRSQMSRPATVEVLSYQQVVGKVAPDRASGRLKARMILTVRNHANSPTEVVVHAEDADGECTFRFAQPSITVLAGQGVEAPFTVFPPKQIWIGRAHDRAIRVTATPSGSDIPPPALPAVYRQRPWLPWWLSVAAPLVIAAAVLFVLLSPKQTQVPNLKSAGSVFQAQKILTARGLVLAPTVRTRTVAGATPGAIVDQVPGAGTKVKKGAVVSVVVDVAPSTVKVPSVAGMTPVAADATLHGSQLVLGAVSPEPSPNGKIASQIPAAGETRKAGTAVAVFLVPAVKTHAAAAGAAAGAGAAGGAAAGPSGSASSSSSTSAASSAGSGSGGANPGATAAKTLVIPTLAGKPVNAAAQQLSKLGLVPSTRQVLSTGPVGMLVGTDPAAGKSIAAGKPISLLLSSGYPDLSYDDGSVVHVVDGADGKAAVSVPTSGGPESKLAWAPDGHTVVYVSGGQLFLLDLATRGAEPRPLTPAGSGDADPSFAPVGKAMVIAFIAGTDRLCFAAVGPSALHPDCIKHPGYALGGETAWSPDGTKLLVRGTANGSGLQTFGLVEFTSNIAASAHASDWGAGAVVTPHPKAGEGVIYGAFSPDGKQVAMASNIGTYHFQLVIGASDFDLTKAAVEPVAACQVAWRPDGERLAVMQADSACRAPTGDIAVVDPNHPQVSRTIATVAADPAWQPLTGNG